MKALRPKETETKGGLSQKLHACSSRREVKEGEDGNLKAERT